MSLPLCILVIENHHSSSQTELFSLVQTAPLSTGVSVDCISKASKLPAIIAFVDIFMQYILGVIYDFFMLLKDFFTVNNIDTFLHLAQSLTREVVDCTTFSL